MSSSALDGSGGGAQVNYEDVFLEVPDLSFPLLDICETFFGRPAAEALLRRSQAALRSVSTQQIVVTLPFECLPTLEDAYELVVDWTGLEMYRPSLEAEDAKGYDEGQGQGGANAEEGHAEAEELVHDDETQVSERAAKDGHHNEDRRQGDVAVEHETDARRQNQVPKDETPRSNAVHSAAEVGGNSTATAGTGAGAVSREQYEVALLNVLEHMGVGDLFTLAVQQRAERIRREARGGNGQGLGMHHHHSSFSSKQKASGPAMDEAIDETMTLLSLNAPPTSVGTVVASSPPHPASASALGLPAAGTPLDRFGAMVYRRGVYNPFASLPPVDSSLISTASVDDANGHHQKRRLVPASTLSAALSSLAKVEQEEVGSGKEEDLDQNLEDVYRYNDAIVKRWRSEEPSVAHSSSALLQKKGQQRYTRVEYVPHHTAYAPTHHYAMIAQRIVAFDEE